MLPPSRGSRLARLFRLLETPRLRLEPIRTEHADLMFAGLQDPSLYRYQTDERPRTLATLRERYRRLSSGRSPDRRRYWLNWIVLLRDNGEAAGYVQATVQTNLSEAEIGYLVLAAHRGCGVGTEAVGAMVRHLFARRIRLLRAVVDRRNAASIALVERLGFERRGMRASDDVIDGIREFDYDYELRKSPSEADRPR